MSETPLLSTLLILIPALPLAATLLTAALGKRVLRRRSHLPVVLAIAASCAASVLLVFAVRSGAEKTTGYHKVVTTTLKLPGVITRRLGEDAHRLLQDRHPLDLGQCLGLPSPSGRGAGGEGFCDGRRRGDSPSP